MPETHIEREMAPNYYATDHFLYNDFVCPCCDMLKLVPGFYHHVSLLEQMRLRLGYPIIVNSGYRCQKHNTEVGGSARSWHMLFATDIRPEDSNGEKLKAMYEMAIDIGFGGVGRYETFIHVDLRPERLMWRG